MRLPRTAAVALAGAALLVPRSGATEVVIGGRLFGGYSTYAMGDWDDVMRELNVPAGTMAPADDGHSLGLGVEMAWRRSLYLCASYERLVPGRLGEVNGQKLRLPANALLLEVECRRRVAPRILLGVGGGAGYYQLGDETESPGTGRNMEGSAPGGQAFGLGEWELTPALAIGLDVGYRWALVDVGNVNRHPPASQTDVDYSGLQTRLVLRLHPRGAR